MAITYPRTDVLSSVRYSSATNFKLSNTQEYSKQANGVVRGKDLGPALWVANYTTVELLNYDAIAFEAMLNSLDGVINPFEAGDIRKRYPRNYPTGVFTDSGALLSVNSNNKALALSGLPASFVLSVGDYLAFDYGASRALHQVVEGVTANGSGTTTQFEVRPYIRAGWTLTTAVKLKNPNGRFTLVPDSIQTNPTSTITSTVSFKAVQYL